MSLRRLFLPSGCVESINRSIWEGRRARDSQSSSYSPPLPSVWTVSLYKITVSLLSPVTTTMNATFPLSLDWRRRQMKEPHSIQYEGSFYRLRTNHTITHLLCLPTGTSNPFSISSTSLLRPSSPLSALLLSPHMPSKPLPSWHWRSLIHPPLSRQRAEGTRGIPT
jgi:hypothetical protein